MPKEAAFGDLLAEISKKHDLRVGAASAIAEPITWLTTGNLAIDYVAGGGLPLGRSVELYGPPSSGKSTTGIQAAAALQQDIIAADRDEYMLYWDFEHTFDADYAGNLGLDADHPSFLLTRPRTMEQGAEAALKFIDSGKIRLIVFDSVAAMAPLARLEGDFDQRTAAMNKARLMAGFMLQLTPLLHTRDTCGVFVNHAYEAVEMTGRPGMPPKTTTPGGRALKYYASLRLEYQLMGQAKTKTVDPLTGAPVQDSVGVGVKVRCTKNKLARPARAAETRISYGAGFDNTWSALQVLITHKKIIKSGAWHYFPAAKVPDLIHPEIPVTASGRAGLQGESAVLRFANEHPSWRTALIAEATTVLETLGSGEPEVFDPFGDDE